MTEAKSNWISNYRVHSFHCNNKEIIRLSSVAKYLQEIAWEHAEDCGAGYKTLQPEGVLWILYGLRMEISEFPVWNDILSVETWGKKYENLFAYRDFEIKNESEGHPVVRATSSWLLVDSKTHKPRRITQKLRKIPAVERDALSVKPGLVEAFKSYDNGEDLRVVFSDIDIYNHVSNTSYIQYCINSSSELQSNAHRIKTFDIKFIQESRLGDELIIKYTSDKNTFYFRGEKRESGREVFRAMVSL